ncbi:alpha/beta hydrolase family protein [Luteococcus peritonei]|uniref:Alpha/beta hydrolase family protein n=1 Tax=Luteococcus peritonei TaxID=88874 RepID=A0ABW4RWI8_9ACTN
MTTLTAGSWPSPVTVDALLGAATSLSSLDVDGDQVLWLESRPQEDGRTTLVHLQGDELQEITPAPMTVRSRVQEYGGGAWHAAGGTIAWCDDADRTVKLAEAGQVRTITTGDAGLVHGDLRVVPRHRLVLAVREDQRAEGEAVTEIVALSMDSDNADGGTVLAHGADFYAHPELSEDDRLAWVEWSHPNMPWDGTRLMVARFAPDGLGEARQVAGGDQVSVVHPLWGSDGRLFFLGDESGFWNPWVCEGEDCRQLLVAPHDMCRPLWVLGNQAWAVLDDDHLALMTYVDGAARLGLLEVSTGRLRSLEQGFADVDSIAAGPAGLFAVVSHADRGDELVRIDPESLAATVVRRSYQQLPDPAWVSRPESIWFEGRHGRSQAWYYPPTSPDSELPAGELPPVIVNTHGGPTGMAPSSWNPGFQFWTSRGFAVLDVNYSGSAGFGREYRNRLRGSWGVADIDDCVDAVRSLVDRGLADERRVVIQGGSAGGYTTLQALVSSDVFAAGVSRYGIGDLEMLATDTHKFESRYPFGLVGPYPEARELYRERSPIHHVERLSSPMLILQGLDDKVVPPNQAEAMAEAVRAKQLPVALVLFEGEGHGFRKLSTRRAVVEAQLSFFSQLFGFTPADEVPRLEIENL